MKYQKLLRKIPFGVHVQRNLNKKSTERLLNQLETLSHTEKQIRKAIVSLQRELSPSDQSWVDEIESERERLLQCEEPLVDGSLDEGIYDKDLSISRACKASKPAKPALFLFWLTRLLGPQTVIELGTNVGISSAYMGAGLKAGGMNGEVTTMDISPYRQRLAYEIHDSINISNISYVTGPFTETLTPVLAKLKSVDLAFIDGHHQYQPTLDYFEEIVKYSNPGTVFVFDDIRWSDGMKKAWSRIQDDDRLGSVIDLTTVGICTRRQNDDYPRFVSKPCKFF